MRLKSAAAIQAESRFAPTSSDERLVAALTEHGLALSAADVPAVEALLLSTSSAKVRNAAALALLDVGYPRLERAINDLLRRPTIPPVAGTLLFCLKEAGLKIAASEVANIVRGGSFEARSELLVLTSAGSVLFDSEDQVEALKGELAGLASGRDEEAAEVAAMALEDFGSSETTGARLPPG